MYHYFINDNLLISEMIPKTVEFAPAPAPDISNPPGNISDFIETILLAFFNYANGLIIYVIFLHFHATFLINYIYYGHES